MGFNLKLYFTINASKELIFYDTGLIKSSSNGNIRFIWREGNVDITMKTNDFKLNGITITNNHLCHFSIEVISDIDILIGNNNSSHVYKVEGSLPNFSNNGVIKNFDRSILPLFDTSTVLDISSNLLVNFSNVKILNNIFSDHREWRTISDSSKGNQLLEIPINLLKTMNQLEVLKGFNRMDNILHIPVGVLDSLNRIKVLHVFNDCKVLHDIMKVKINSAFIYDVCSFNNNFKNCIIPTDIITSAGDGYLNIAMFNGVNNDIKKYSFGRLIYAPKKSVLFISNLLLDGGSKVSNIVECKYKELGTFNCSSIVSDDDIVTYWSNFMNNHVIPNLRSVGDYSGINNIYSKITVKE